MPGQPTDFDMHSPFTWAAAVAAGISTSSLRGPRFSRIFTGVYVHSSVQVSHLVRVQASLLIHPPLAFASHMSAAHVYDVPVPDLPEVHVSVFDKRDRRRRAAIRNHVARAGTPVIKLRGVRVSATAQMFVELAELLNLVDLVVVGDALVRNKRLTPVELLVYCEQSGLLAAAAARRAARYVRAEVDSPMETRLRMLIVLAGLPEPLVNFKVYYNDGRVRYRFDLSYAQFKVVVEYDGRQHREDLDQWDHDTERRDWFDHNGWMLVPVFSRGIFRRPDETLQRVLKALRSRGCRDLPRRVGDEWRIFFPVRT